MGKRKRSFVPGGKCTGKYHGDWDICKLPEEEFQAIVTKRLREFHERSEAENATRCRGRGYHFNDMPTCKSEEMGKWFFESEAAIK